MKISVDISLYPLADDYIPAIKAFIGRISEYDDIALVPNDLSTQLFGDYDRVMEVLGIELKRSWQTYGKGVFVIKYLLGDRRKLAGQADTTLKIWQLFGISSAFELMVAIVGNAFILLLLYSCLSSQRHDSNGVRPAMVAATALIFRQAAQPFVSVWPYQDYIDAIGLA